MKYVLNVVPMHLFACMNLPKTIIPKLNSIMASFVWSNKLNTRRRHWVAWGKITLPKKERGLGLRKFEEVQSAFRMKQVWSILSGSSLWASMFKSKFLKRKSLLQCLGKSHAASFELLRPYFEKVVAFSRVLVGNGINVDFFL